MTTASSTTLAETLPDKERVAESRARLEEAGVKYVLSCWIDLLGLPKTKPVPLSEWEELCAGRGPQFAVHSVSMVPELGPADPDQIAVPDLDSLLVCPWDRRYAWVFADLFWCGTPYAVCPRSALKRQVEVAHEAGYLFQAGIEPEFIVMRYANDGRPVKAFGADPGAQIHPARQPFGYDAEFSLDAMPFLGEITDILEELDWGIANVVAEGAYSQFELDYGYGDVVRTADRTVFLRVMLKELAKKRGLFVTFMAKPTQGDWRNGAHINTSAQSVDVPGVNLFRNGNGGWNPQVYDALGGLTKHARALTAVTCPTVNSYKGFLAQARGLEGGTVTWAPTHICYGENNRSAMFRLPQARGAIENRAADMSMNPHLGLALTIGACLDGLEGELDPAPVVERPPYELTEAELLEARIEPLPGNLLEAIRAFDEDALAKDVLGETMHGSYSRYKHEEWRRFHEHVTDWEVAEYLQFF